MATRWTSKHTGQKIDDTIDCVCNPNLLDNWYFANPVNQRGQTSYTGAGYGIDRWKSGNSALKAELTSAGLAVSSAGASNVYLSQYFDGGIPIEDSYTISALVEAVTGTAFFQAAYSDGTFGSSIKLKQGLNTLAIKTDKTITRVLIQANNSSSVTIIAVKLELGSQQTLAHQDADGNWVLNEIPDYGEQLRRCQRYYLSNKQRNAYGKSTSATTAYVDIPTPVTMRTLPAIETGVIGHIICNGVKTTIASINPVKLNDESITLQLVLNTSVSVDYPVFLTDTKYALSADL